VAGVVLIGVLSSAFARQSNRRVQRRMNGAALLLALDRHCAWLVAQRQAMAEPQNSQPHSSALEEIRALQRQCFPELRAQVQPLLDLHARMIDFLVSQHALRLRDPEAWLKSNHDTRFMALLRQHFGAVQLLTAKLKAVSGATDWALEPGTESPAWRGAAHPRGE
jgi:hypothetical protein